MPIDVHAQVEAGKTELKNVLTGAGTMANGRATVFADILIEAAAQIYIKQRKEEYRLATIAKREEYRARTITLQQFEDWKEANRPLEDE